MTNEAALRRAVRRQHSGKSSFVEGIRCRTLDRCSTPALCAEETAQTRPDVLQTHRIDHAGSSFAKCSPRVIDGTVAGASLWGLAARHGVSRCTRQTIREPLLGSA